MDDLVRRIEERAREIRLLWGTAGYVPTRPNPLGEPEADPEARLRSAGEAGEELLVAARPSESLGDTEAVRDTPASDAHQNAAALRDQPTEEHPASARAEEARRGRTARGFAHYQEARLDDFRTGRELRTEGCDVLAKMFDHIVQVEGPVHFETVMERLRARYGMGRAKDAVRSQVLRCLEGYTRTAMLTMDRRDAGYDLFLLLPDVPVGPRGAGITGARPAEHVHPRELQAGIMAILKQIGRAYRDELIVDAARNFGWNRTGSRVRDALDKSIDALLREQRVVESAGLLRLP